MPSVAEKQTRQANIYLAASDNDVASVTQFLDSGVDVNGLDENGYSTLHAASSYNHFELLKFLVSRGGNVNLMDNEGDTPIYVAETKEMCALLLELGADLGHRNHEGKTVLEYAREEDEYPEVVGYLQTCSNSGTVEASGLGARYETTTTTANDATMEMMDALPVDVRTRIGEILSKSAEDGIDRDEELRTILSDAILGQGVLESRSRQRTE